MDSPTDQDAAKRTREYKRGMAFMGCIAGISMVLGFGMTVARAKKQDPTGFAKGMVGGPDLHESGTRLALRALGWGTLYAVSGFSLFCFGVWKMMGVQNMEEFRAKMQKRLPRVPKSENPGRSEFKNTRELVEYLISEDERAKPAKD